MHSSFLTQHGAPDLARSAAEPSDVDANDLLERVIGQLDSRKGQLREIARIADMSYDTVRRIRSRENDPGYRKVKQLATVLGLKS